MGAGHGHEAHFFDGLAAAAKGNRIPQAPSRKTAGSEEAIAVSRSAMAIRSSPSASESTIEQHSLPVGAADYTAEPMAPFLTLTMGVEQEVEGNIGLSQLPPKIPEHVEAVIARWMCAAISVIRCSFDRSVLAMDPFCSEVVGVADLQQRSFAAVGVAGVEAVQASGSYYTPILAHNTIAWPMHATAQPWHAEGLPSPTGALRWLHTRSSCTQAKYCKRCKRNSSLGPWSKRMDLTPTSTDPCPRGRNARPETPLFSCTFSCRQEKRVLGNAENPCCH
jgi:hypothetical protein